MTIAARIEALNESREAYEASLAHPVRDLIDAAAARLEETPLEELQALHFARRLESVADQIAASGLDLGSIFQLVQGGAVELLVNELKDLMVGE